MSLSTEEQLRKISLMAVAQQMMLAARTAPKARGINTLEMAVAEGETIQLISDKMKEIGARPYTSHAFLRDAESILESDFIFLVGTKIKAIGLTYCGLCGFKNCEEKQLNERHPCAFNTGDLGIAIGSAVSIAMDSRVDNRVMYTIGMAAMELGIFSNEVKIIYGIPLSASSKNIFFDRKS
jgi:uncharacterized ferredoxin-like protein